MKKITLLFSIFAFISITSVAQVIYTEDFESLNVGEGIALQVPEWWKTWSDNPGGADDADISENYSVSGTKSLMVLSDQDVVMTTGHLTEGRYKMSFEMFVAEGEKAYLSAMQLFDPENENYGWGVSLRFDNGLVEVDYGAGTEPISIFVYDSDTWLEFTYIIDLDGDFVDIIINEELRYSRVWSEVDWSYSLEGFMFYGWPPAEYYIDDIVFEQLPSVDPPQNLSLQLQNINDVLVSWDAPESGTPDSYYVYRNGVFVEEVVETTSFTDLNLYPNEYGYYVTANYGTEHGFSIPTETETIIIEGGVPRQLAVLEIFTGTECHDAGWIATSLSLLHNQNLDVTVLNYFSDENYQIENMSCRMDYYTPFFDSNQSGDLMCPSSIVDGRTGMEGYTGSPATQSNFWSSNISKTLEINTLYAIEKTIEQTSTSSYTFAMDVEIEKLFDFYSGDFNVYMALTESDIEESYQGITTINNMVRLLDSQTIDFSGEESVNVTFNFTVSNEYSMPNINLIVFLQHVETAEIVEASTALLSEYANIENNALIDYSVYPNPAAGTVYVKSPNIQSIYVKNLEGKTILYKNNINSDTSSFDLSKQAKGIYILKIVTENGVAIDKLILK